MDCAPASIESTSAGGAGYGTIFAFTAACHGQASRREVIHTFTGADGANPVGRLVRLHDGSLIGVTQNAGHDGHGSLFRLTPPGQGSDKWVLTVIKPFCAQFYCLDGGNPNGNISHGPIYRGYQTINGTTDYGGKRGAGTVWHLIVGPHGYGYYVLDNN